MLPIDNEKVLNYYYEDRTEFVVDFDENLVDVMVKNGEVIFKLKKGKNE